MPQETTGLLINQGSLLSKNYDQDENVLTKALLHVIEAGCHQFLPILLNALDLCNDFQTYEVHTQKRITSAVDNTFIVCDGLIQTRPFQLIIESKIKPKSINETQFDNQLKIVKELNNQGTNAILFYITPDISQPEELYKERVAWTSWENLISILRSTISPFNCIQVYLLGAFEALYHKIFRFLHQQLNRQSL